MKKHFIQPGIGAICALLTPMASAQVLQLEVNGGHQDRLGFSVSPAGDVNGDGVGDVAVGAIQAFEGPNTNTVGPGYARVYSGNDGSLLLEAIGKDLGDAFGYSVAGIGDLDGDGHDDLAVGATQLSSSGSRRGYVHILSGANGSLLHEFEGASPGDQAGQLVRGLGDISGDGVPDLLWTAPGNDEGALEDVGLVVVVDGATGLTLASHRADPGHQLGLRVYTGEFDGDGIKDYAALASPPQGNTFVRIWSGADFSEITTLLSLSADDTVGDVSGDGIDDFTAGLNLIDGSNGDLILSFNINPTAYPFFEKQIAVSGGDHDGDGMVDIIASGTSILESGQTLILNTADGGVPFNVGYPATALANLGDLDGDGDAEWAMGFTNTNPLHHAGVFRIYLGGEAVPTRRFCLGSGILGFQGTTSLSSNQMSFRTILTPAGQFGVLFFGTRTQHAPFGLGHLCVGGDILRAGPPVAMQSEFTELPIDFGAAPFLAGAGLLTPGDVRIFQFWYRSPPSFTLTSALEVTFGI